MKSWHYSNSWTLLSKDIHINVKMILGNAQADMNMLGWYINMLGLVVLVFAIRSSRLCWLASAMIKRRWSSNITSGKLSLRFAICHCQSCSCKLFWLKRRFLSLKDLKIWIYAMPANSQVPMFFRLDLYRGSENRPHICHRYHRLYPWKKSVMWRNFIFL